MACTVFREDEEMPYKNFVLDEKITQKAKRFLMAENLSHK